MLSEIEAKVAAGEPFTLTEAAGVMASSDLVRIGVLADAARRDRTGDRGTFCRVTVVDGGGPADAGDAGEIRIVAAVASIDDALARVRATVAWAGGTPVTAFTLGQLQDLCGHDNSRLEQLARDLLAAGLSAVAEVPVDAATSDQALIDAVQAVTRAGLGAWRATIGQADVDDRMALLERARVVVAATGAFRALAPLPRIDRVDTPSTGYDDVKTVAVARLLCRDIEYIQVDWPLYGPKLAQVALTFGANDIDGVASTDTLGLGPRRSPLEDIRRQIQAAGSTPVERDGRYAPRN